MHGCSGIDSAIDDATIFAVGFTAGNQRALFVVSASRATRRSLVEHLRSSSPLRFVRHFALVDLKFRPDTNPPILYTVTSGACFETLSTSTGHNVEVGATP